jgi:hypothetical protein
VGDRSRIFSRIIRLALGVVCAHLTDRFSGGELSDDLSIIDSGHQCFGAAATAPADDPFGPAGHKYSSRLYRNLDSPGSLHSHCLWIVASSSLAVVCVSVLLA